MSDKQTATAEECRSIIIKALGELVRAGESPNANEIDNVRRDVVCRQVIKIRDANDKLRSELASLREQLKAAERERAFQSARADKMQEAYDLCSHQHYDSLRKLAAAERERDEWKEKATGFPADPYWCSRLDAAERENARLREVLGMCKTELSFLIDQTRARKHGSVCRAYSAAAALLAQPEEAKDAK